MPFARGAFDIVVDVGCLHHQRKADWPQYRQAILRTLRPRGFLILSVFSPRFRFFRSARRQWHIAQGAYRRCFTSEDIITLFGEDFDIIALEEERGAGGGFWHALMQRATLRVT